MTATADGYFNYHNEESRPLRIGIIVGEPSGDALAASLIEALRQHYPAVEIEGITGPKTEAVGCKRLFAMEPLSVMGIFEPLARLPEILRLRKQIKAHFIVHRPDIFIGIDAPAFNLGIEVALHKVGITTVHYVSPTIWAWKKNRIHKIKRAVDLMLCLLPFEPEIYAPYQVAAKFVGHPLADEIPLQPDQQAARQQLQLAQQNPVLAVLPGSRSSEIKHLTCHFLEAIYRCRQHLPTMQVIVPMVNAKRRQQFEDYIKRYLQKKFPRHDENDFSVLGIMIIDGQARLAMTAADVVLLASGTATLEAMLVKKPMVVTYRFTFFNALLAKLLVRTKFVSWPNLLAGRALVTELIQYQVNGKNIARHLLKCFRQDNQSLIKTFTELHQQLKQGASQQAAKAIVQLIE
ncbi:MAG: lipid-A-disaccharide synthase [Gammaproteobacteria bacterium]|nr:lipid-A-disaccharide synthase [Gammaproteobacteria bacterium]